jgi:16S rRNA (cytosine967-C5)-methyltransferase
MNPRDRALALLRRIEREGLYASLVLLEEPGLVRAMVLGVLRWRSRLDFSIESFARRPVRKIDPLVLDVLRLGVCQLHFMDVAPHAAVAETVALSPARARGFVNAVLRRASEGRGPEPEDAATRYAHPRWLFDRWVRTFGEERAERIAAANQELSYPDVLSLDGSVPPDAEPSELAGGLWRLRGSSAALDRGSFYPMDEGSAVIASMARACGDDVLDLAAAPGGKTIFMRHAGARVVAGDRSLSRLQPLAGRGPVVAADGRRPPFARRFEVVLLDAPCSATGTIRKNPELKWRLEEKLLPGLAALQRDLLESAVRQASRYVVYSTCSLEPEENDAIVNGFDRADVTPFVPAGARRWVENGVLRLTPDSGADGFTAFVIRV